MDSFGWRDGAHTARQSWCRSCLSRASQRARNRQGRDGREHLRNHYDAALTICGKSAEAANVASHFFDQEPTTTLPACASCARLDEEACIQADAAQRAPRGPFDSNPYRSTYLATVERLREEQPA
ncbi:hypothetical protein [Homoserinibacter sp. GY 40078]|uniref:hypothetical protein n=1 Tax=Homoserinibacter sp. GY 40078 TaxID=2603275 RepID=UPI00164F65B2|nr:hypothetical protein [Homoserinibacter sp. GY 40078]